MTHTPSIRILLVAAALAACNETQSPPIVAKGEDAKPATPPAPEAKVDAKVDAKEEPAKVEAKAEPTPEAKAEAPAEAKPEEPAAPSEPVAAAEPGGPGPAFFAVDKKGVVRLDGGKFVALKDGPDRLIKNLHIAGDGTLWALGFETIYKLPNLGADAFKEVTKAGFSETGSVDDFFVIAEDDIWAAGFGGVSHWDGKDWTKEEKSAIGAGDDLLEGVVVGRDGKVWVASSGKVHVKENGAWSTVDLSKAKGGRLFMESIERAADGSIYALSSTALIKLGPTTADVSSVKLGGGSFASYSDLALGTDGTIAARNLFDLVVRAPDGKMKTWKQKAYMSEGVRALAVDALGRVWVGSEIGATVLGPGDAKVEWRSGAVPEMAGEVIGIAVAGAGPAELPTGGPLQTGGLTGKVLKGGQPVAKADVELCPSPAMLFSKSPCAESSVRFAGKTDDQGVWKFDGVPLGAYGIAIRTAGKWKITMGSNMGSEMKPDEVYDVGSISLE